MNALEKASVALFFASSALGINSVIDAINIHNQLERSPGYNRSLALDSASGDVRSAEADLTYDLSATNIGIYPPLAINFPNGNASRAHIDSAVLELDEEPIIQQELGTLELNIPQANVIDTVNGIPVSSDAFQEERDKMEAIRSEIDAISAENKAPIKDLIDQEQIAILKAFLFWSFALFVSPTVGTLGYIKREYEEMAKYG